MIGSSPPAVTFCERVADSMCAENPTFWDTEDYIYLASFHTPLSFWLLM